ncbi:MAG TPA: rhomboid family intramembrane serine protease, partial [Verrucomicrobiae bacterium]|nr:rhomboid family intramembrane serine protease [Verrucomicrobiae bacterium]
MRAELPTGETPITSAPNGRIPVRSRRQAMEWSLVLASQGIESVIEFSKETGEGWALFIDPANYAAAIRNLRQYKLENRGWPWVNHMPWPGISFHWGSLAWAMLLGVVYWFSVANPRFVEAAVMNKTAVFNGEWWRLFTAMLLHADLGHLATNLSLGVLLLGLVMGRYGGGLGLLAAYLAGAAGNLAFLFVHSALARGLGASGMIMGALGLLAVQSLPIGRGRGVRPSRKYWIAGLLAGTMMFILFGLSPDSDTVVHLGGFVSGLILGVALTLAPER